MELEALNLQPWINHNHAALGSWGADKSSVSDWEPRQIPKERPLWDLKFNLEKQWEFASTAGYLVWSRGALKAVRWQCTQCWQCMGGVKPAMQLWVGVASGTCGWLGGTVTGGREPWLLGVMGSMCPLFTTTGCAICSGTFALAGRG